MTRAEKVDLLRRLGTDPDVSRMIAIVLQRTKMIRVGDLPDEELDLLIDLSEDLNTQLTGGEWLPGGSRG